MKSKTVKMIVCMLAIAAIFACIGCAGRAGDRNNTGAGTPTPSPAPTASVTPSPTVPPSVPGNYTTGLSLDDIYFSGGDEQEGYAEDLLPTPPAD